MITFKKSKYYKNYIYTVGVKRLKIHRKDRFNKCMSVLGMGDVKNKSIDVQVIEWFSLVSILQEIDLCTK